MATRSNPGADTGTGHGALRAAAAVALYLVVGTALAAVCSAFLVRTVEGRDSAFARLVLLKGPAKVTIRFMQLFALAFLPPLLRAIGWRGRADIGWRGAGAAPAWRDATAGVLLGIATLAPLAWLQVAAGVRTWVPVSFTAAALAALSFLPSAVVVGLIEETLARGMVYRALARRWTPVPAALVLSSFFAYIHFLRPADTAFQGANGWTAAREVFLTTFTAAPAAPQFWVRMATLGVMSLVLCTMVQRRGTVWLAAGTHAAWVWCLRMNARLTNAVWEAPVTPWLRHRPDLTDSAAAALLLGVLLAILLLARRRGKG